MKPWVAILCCCPLLAFPIAAQTANPKPPTTSRVQGKIIQQPGGQPIRKAAVVLLSTAHDQDRQSETAEYHALTDAEGHFKIEEVKPGNYSLYFGREGFVDAEKRHHGSGMQLWLEAGQEVKDLLLHMAPAAVIVGKVRDDDGDPISSIDVIAIPYGAALHGEARSSTLNDANQCSTDDLGQCRLSGLTPGRYLVVARAGFRGSRKQGEVYVPTYYPGRTDKKQAVPLDLRPGDELPVDLTLALSHTFHVRGHVTQLPAWTKQEAAELMLESEDRDRSFFDSFDATVDGNGAFNIAGVPPGSYTVRLWPTRVPGPQTYFDAQSPQVMRTDEIVRVVDADVNDLRITPLPNSWVRGRLRMDAEQKTDWSDMVVGLWNSNAANETGNGLELAGVKRDGSFETPILAGSYHLRLSRAGNLPPGYYLKAVNLGGKDVADAGFAAGGANLSLDIVIGTNAARVDGVVSDEQDKPSSSVEVICIPEVRRRASRDRYRQVTTDARGHFSLRELAPGEYQIFALDDDFDENEIADPEFVRVHESLGQTIELKEGEIKNVVLKLVASSD